MRRRWFFGLIAIGLLLGAVGVWGLAWGYWPPGDFPVGRAIEIKSGQSLSEIAGQLAAERLISSPIFFNFWLAAFGLDDRIVAGFYEFERPLSSLLLAKRLVSGQFAAVSTKVVIPEGLNAGQIGKIIGDAFPNLDQGEFLKLAEAHQGFLFPATYFLPPHSSAEQIIAVMRRNFDRQMAKRQNAIIASALSLTDLIAIASLVEEEAALKADRRLIADILRKRFAAGQKLEVDVEPGTYDYQGLPSRPIVNPGLEAIEAVLQPAESNYWFYLSDKTGTIHYAATFAEHQQNIVRYLK